MTREDNTPWKEKTSEEYFTENGGPLITRSGTEHPSDIGAEAWLLEQIPSISNARAKELLREYGIVANIPTKGSERKHMVQRVPKIGWETAEDLQITLRNWEKQGVVGGMGYDSNDNPYTIFFPDELKDR